MEKIKKYRLKKGYTQIELAHLAGISQNTVSQYENGARRPNVKVARRLADILECSIEELFPEDTSA